MPLTGYRWTPVRITEPADPELHGVFVYGYAPGTDERDGPAVTLQVWDEEAGEGGAVADTVADVLNASREASEARQASRPRTPRREEATR